MDQVSPVLATGNHWAAFPAIAACATDGRGAETAQETRGLEPGGETTADTESFLATRQMV